MVKRSQAARAAAAASVSAITALVVHAGGCGGTEADAPEGGDPALADAGVDRRVPGKWTEWQPEESPSPLEGWKLLSDYPGCGFYYATDRKYLPPPVAWEPCTVVTDAANLTDAGPSGPPGMVCERMATPPNGTAPTGAYLRSVHVEGGRALLLVNRGFENGSGFIIGKSNEVVSPLTYAVSSAPIAIAVAMSSCVPPRYVE